MSEHKAGGINDLIERRIEAERKLIAEWLLDCSAGALARFMRSGGTNNEDASIIYENIARQIERGEYKKGAGE